MTNNITLICEVFCHQFYVAAMYLLGAFFAFHGLTPWPLWIWWDHFASQMEVAVPIYISGFLKPWPSGNLNYLFKASAVISGFLILTASSLDTGQQVCVSETFASETQVTDFTSVTLSDVGFDRRRSAWRLHPLMTLIVFRRVHPWSRLENTSSSNPPAGTGEFLQNLGTSLQ